jgi:dihydrofolate synthase / folylpolyglutamate synthase
MGSLSVGTDAASYHEAITFLYSLERFGILLGLDNIRHLLEKLDNPQHRFPVVHVAGSNGKGSTASLITGILRESGLKTALYTSPHLNDFRERIRLNGSLVTKEALVASTEKVRKLFDPERTTFFEFTTAVAFDCIAQAKPDVAVIEVGLGGRLDATNTVRPMVTVITDISREHEDYLGTGLAAVATEKAGIIKKGIPLVTGASRKEARSVILQVAKDRQAPVKEFGRDFKGMRTGNERFSYTSASLALADLAPTMAGSYQIKNASLAIAAIEELIALGYPITEKSLRAGIAGTQFPGRFELLRKEPDVVIDGAHTVEGMRLLKSTVRRMFPGKRPLLLLGMLGDKDFEKLTGIIVPVGQKAVCVKPQGDRALDPERLAEEVRRFGISATTAPTVEEGFAALMEEASRDDLILAAGSLYMIGPVRRACGIEDS